MEKNIVIILSRIVDLDGKELTIGGIQTYLKTLCYVINRDLGIRPVIYQNGNVDFTKKFESFDVVGVKTKKTEKCQVVFDRVSGIYKNQSNSTLIIWGSDQYAIRQKTFKSISIQHGIAFDTLSDVGIKGLLVKLGLQRIYKYLQRTRAINLVERSNNIVCVDYNFLNWYRTYRNNYKRNIKVIPNFTRVPPCSVEKDNKTIKIVYARRFVHRRGVDIALFVAKKIVEKFDNVEFYFAGSGPQKSDIQELSDNHERIFLTSYASDESLKFHQDFSIAIVPSVGSEGTSLSLLEAMASNCAVVASNVGGMTNIVLSGYNGLLVSPDESEFLSSIEELITDLQKLSKLQSNGYLTVRESFNQSSWEKQWVDFIKSVID